MTSIAIDKIRLNGGTQSRTVLDQATIDDYRDALQAGATFPPVIIFHDGSEYWLADGFHRLHAHIMRRLPEIEADVRQGTRRDAVLYSVGANASHGLRRTNDDKRRAVQTLLADSEWQKWSDHKVANFCAVSPTFVGTIRKSLSAMDSEPRTYVTKHGTIATMNVAAIGRPAPSAVNDNRASAAALLPAAQPAPDPIIIGDATLYCADCRDVFPLLGKVSHILTDPPYEAQAHRQGRVTNASINKGVDATLTFEAISEELRTYVAAQAKRLSEGWAIYFCQAEGVHPWMEAILTSGAKYRMPAVWTKPDASPNFTGNGPAPAFEMLALSWCGDGDSKWNGRGKRGVYTHNVNVGRHGGHQTEKPLTLLRELLLDFTQPGDTVLDPFMGIGSVGVACLELGRRYIGIEMDRGYFDVAVERIGNAGGLAAA